MSKALEIDAELIHNTLVDGKLRLCVYLASDCETDEVNDHIAGWYADGESTSIGVWFDLQKVLNDLIEGNQMPSYGNAIDADAKQIFGALRADAEAIIKRIDALKFA